MFNKKKIKKLEEEQQEKLKRLQKLQKEKESLEIKKDEVINRQKNLERACKQADKIQAKAKANRLRKRRNRLVFVLGGELEKILLENNILEKSLEDLAELEEKVKIQDQRQLENSLVKIVRASIKATRN